jgi:hypothetical protein
VKLHSSDITGLTDIHFTSQYRGSFRVRITNIIGDIIINEKYDKKSDEKIFPVDLRKIPSGLYYYQICINDTVVVNGSITVNH